MVIQSEFQAHLDTGATTLCRCWEIRRKDGAAFGFTDHDRDLSFGGMTFKADTGLSAQAVEQTTGLSVNNAEVVGILSSAAVTETDLAAGRFDGAEVWAWLVNWNSVGERHLVFRGTVGEVSSGGGEFRAELRGLSEALNRPRGRVFQRLCDAVLGDGACGIDLGLPNYSTLATIASVIGQDELLVSGAGAYTNRWFERGRLEVISGAAAGLGAFVKMDVAEGTLRRVTLWQQLSVSLAAGDTVRIEAGCDKRLSTCRSKFGNTWNFRGFPHIPGEDWMMAYPRKKGDNDGGSRNR